MIKCFYIANASNGEYFVLEEDINAYIQKIVAYGVHLRNSAKVPNTYMMGSVELSRFAYDQMRAKAIGHQEERIKADAAKEVEEPVPEEPKEGKLLSFPNKFKENDQDNNPEPA